MLAAGFGITNLVNRATATAAELSPTELRAGAARLEATAQRFAPTVLAVVGISAYRIAFARPNAAMGSQPEHIGPSRLWVLPNPSGLNARYQLPELTRAFAALRGAT